MIPYVLLIEASHSASMESSQRPAFGKLSLPVPCVQFAAAASGLKQLPGLQLRLRQAGGPQNATSGSSSSCDEWSLFLFR